MSGFYAKYSGVGGGGAGAGVSSLNLLTGALTLAGGTGISISDNGVNTITIASTLVTGDLTDVGTDGITITNGTGAVIGTGTAISQHVADATHNGYLASADWVTFNAKQPAGNYITALTGDATAAGPGSAALTLATVNGNVGSFGSASSVSTFTVNGKGLITAAGSTAIQIAESQVTNLVSDLAAKQSTTLTNTHVLVGNASNVATDVALSGDATLANTGALTLATVNANVGSFGSASQASAFTVNAKGLITAASNVSIQIAESQVTNLVSDLAAKQSTTLTSTHILVGNVSNVATDVAVSGDATLANNGALTLATVNSNVGSFGTASAVSAITVNAKGLVTAAASTSIQIAESQVTNLVSDLAGKQPTGNYITALTGDATASGPGSAALTLATVNANVGSFGDASTVPSFTVNGKGLITAASSATVIAPAGTLTGTTLASNVVTSSLTTVGTIGTGTWSATTIAVNKGGTGQTTYTDGQLLIGNSSGNTLSKSTLTAGTGISITNGNGTISIASSGTVAAAWNYTSQTTAYNAVINDFVICSSSSFTVTLPTAASLSGQQIAIKHNGTSLTQKYTLNTTSAQTINGPNGTVASGSYILCTNGEVLILVSDGSNWQVQNHYTHGLIYSSASAPTFSGSTSGTFTPGTNTTSIKIYRFGTKARYQFVFKQTAAGTAGVGNVKIPLPTGITGVTTDSGVYTGTDATVASGSKLFSAGGSNTNTTGGGIGIGAYFFDSSTFCVQGTFGGTIGIWGSSANNFTNTILNMNFYVEFEVSDWQP